MKKIRILEMIDRPFLGGGQINLLSLARSLDRERFEVFVCSRDGGPFVDEVKRSNIKYFPVPFSKRVRGKIIREITSILDDNTIDVLHTHGGVAGFYGRWAGFRSRTSVIVHTLHGIHYLHYRNFLLKRLYIFFERYFSRFTDALIFVSDADREKGKRFKLVPEEKMSVIKNGIDFLPLSHKANTDDFKMNKKRELRLESSQPLVGTIARLHRQKGIIYLLKAAEKIHHVFPQLKILIIGGGPLENKLEKKAQKLGLKQYLWFMGERKDATELLSLFDVFVLPSLWEGLPYVLMEASAWGVPVVASDIDGIKEIIQNGETGILVPPKDPEHLAQAVICLLQDKDYALKLGEKMKKEVPPKFTLSRMVEETQNLYMDLIRKKKKGVE